MIITNMNHQVEDNNNMVLLSQFYPHGPIASTGIMAPQQEDPSKPKRRRKRHGADQAGCASHKKRKLTAEQLQFLEMNFEDEQKLEAERKDKLAAELGLDPRQVAVWFQNKRARDKTKKIEESYSSLKTAYENAVTENSRLHSEVAMLREQLSEAEKEVTRLSEMASKNKLTTPLPVAAETVDSPFADVYSPFSVLDSSFSSVSVDSQFSGSFGCFDWEVSSFGSVDGQFASGAFGSFDYHEQNPYMLQNNYTSEAEWLFLNMHF